VGTLGRARNDFGDLRDEVEATCHPLGPNNKLVIAPDGNRNTASPSSGRTSFGAKSPLTGGIKEANAGGISGAKIAKLDWQPSSLKAHRKTKNGVCWW
jgi:aldehyde:ferredoxin oxidoreductase